MSAKYHTKTPLLISVAGLDVELDLVITYSVSRYRAATLTQPEEPRSVEIEEIRCPIEETELPIPDWIEREIADSEGFKAHLLQEAADKDAAAAEDAAEYRREMRAEL
jgi:hypothetical protein